VFFPLLSYAQELVTPNYHRVDVREFAEAVSQITGTKVVIEDGIQGKVTFQSHAPMTIAQFRRAVVEHFLSLGYGYSDRDGVLLIVIPRFDFNREALAISPESIDCGTLVSGFLSASWRAFRAARREMLGCVSRGIRAGREVRTTFVEFSVDQGEYWDTTILLKDQSAILLRLGFEGEVTEQRPYFVGRCPDVVFSRDGPQEQFDLNSPYRVLTGLRCVQDDALGEIAYSISRGGETQREGNVQAP
jgi:hypothetical protein